VPDFGNRFNGLAGLEANPAQGTPPPTAQALFVQASGVVGAMKEK